MWKISRNIIFPRWSKNKQSYVNTKCAPSSLSQRVLSSPSAKDRRHSDQDHKKKQFNQKERFWNRENMDCLFLGASILEKAGWLGAVAILCFNVHVKHFHSMHDFKKRNAHCIFSNDVLAMPLHVQKQETIVPPDKNVEKSNVLSVFNKAENSELSDEVSFFDDVRQMSSQYTAAVHNSSGLSHLKRNAKKAFRHFQEAARLGSSQAFYNLGLCYELGKGTKINLTRAAFCYRKAAMKGHGLASFNLAVYFLKGIGGLPVDHETAKILLTAAAEKDVPEAQLYVGLEYLENNKWLEAFQVFNDLANKNMLDGKYYLGLCYENGWGVKKDESIATEIFAQAAIAGHSKSVLKLSKYYEEGVGASKELFKKHILPTTSERIMHNSSSVPELSTYENTKFKTELKTLAEQSYLGLITPLFTVETQFKSSQATFTIGNQKLELSLTNSLLPHFKSLMYRLMAVKS